MWSNIMECKCIFCMRPFVLQIIFIGILKNAFNGVQTATSTITEVFNG